MKSFSSRNWRNLAEPNCHNQVEWEWSRKQREWATIPRLFFHSRTVEHTQLLAALGGIRTIDRVLSGEL